MLLTNLATVFVGMGLYFGFLGLTQFVQMPREAAGYGFCATRSARQRRRSCCRARSPAFSSRWPAAGSSTGSAHDRCWSTGAVAGIVGFLFIAVWHSAPWQVIVAGIWTNAYISLAYGALPALVVSEAGPARPAWPRA